MRPTPEELIIAYNERNIKTIIVPDDGNLTVYALTKKAVDTDKFGIAIGYFLKNGDRYYWDGGHFVKDIPSLANIVERTIQFNHGIHIFDTI